MAGSEQDVADEQQGPQGEAEAVVGAHGAVGDGGQEHEEDNVDTVAAAGGVVAGRALAAAPTKTTMYASPAGEHTWIG